MNGVGVLAVWSATRRLLVGAAREPETARRALIDPATGLPNRNALQQHIATLEAAGRDDVVVAAIGIDRFDQLSGALGLEVFFVRLSQRYGESSGHARRTVCDGAAGDGSTQTDRPRRPLRRRGGG